MFAVMQENLELVSEAVILEAIQGVKGLTAYDAPILSRDAFGIVAGGLSQEAAEKFASQLTEAGVASVAVDENTFSHLPPVSYTQQIELQSQTLLINDGINTPKEFLYQDIVFIAIGRVDGLKTTSKKVDELVGFRNRRYNSTAIYRTHTEYSQSNDTYWVIEIFFSVAPGRYACIPHGFMFNTLGDDLVSDEDENYCQFALELLKHVPQVPHNLGADELAATGCTVEYPSRHAFDEELKWCFMHNAIKTYEPEKSSAPPVLAAQRSSYPKKHKSDIRHKNAAKKKKRSIALYLSLAAVTIALLVLLANSLILIPEKIPLNRDPAIPENYLNSVMECLNSKWPYKGKVTIAVDGCSEQKWHSGGIRSYPLLLQSKLHKRYPNAKIKVEISDTNITSINAAKKFTKKMLSLKPDVIVLDYGFNDRNSSLTATKQAWGKIIKSAKTSGARVILLTPVGNTPATLLMPNDAISKHAEQIRILAKQHNVALADRRAAFSSFSKSKDGSSLYNIASNYKRPSAKAVELTTSEILRWFPE